jgi:hypothetical protein
MDSLLDKVKSAIIATRKRTCIVCEEKEAKFYIRGIEKNCYCEDCANVQFGDLEMLEKL